MQNLVSAVQPHQSLLEKAWKCRRAGKSSDHSWSLLLTSLYIILLIKTTTCQQEFNPCSVNYALMSNNRNQTGSSKAYCSDEMNKITYVFWHCLENICHISDYRRDTHIHNLSNCPVRGKQPMADAIGAIEMDAVDCFSSVFSITSIPAWSYFKQKKMISITRVMPQFASSHRMQRTVKFSSNLNYLHVVLFLHRAQTLKK